MPIPILLDTDVGTDVDDAYAIVLAAASPELQLRGVTTVNGDTSLRARLAAALLDLLGRGDVPVAAGASDSLTKGETRGWIGHEGDGIDLAADERVDPRHAVELLGAEIEEADRNGTPITLVTIGQMTNAALLIGRHPQAARQLAGIVAMAADFKGFGRDFASGEHNVACDPVAMQRVLASGIPVTLVGLNVTRQTRLDAAGVERLTACGGPLAAALAGMHQIWFRHIGCDHSPMHDPLAVAALFRTDLLEYQPVRVEWWPDAASPGTLVFNPASPGEVTPHRMGVSVDAARFHTLFDERLAAAIRAAAAH